jgi:ATP-dependent helicase/nuclease subunit A
MVARFQNRGYATLARVADHLEELAVGDESNAAIDAVDAVSLMTVHASKGLEFPIVFVVNLGRGTGGARAPIRVAGGAGEPSIAIADYQSEADEDALAREREETKRLLYVALTRARDRLYLSATVQDGAFRPGRGSLGEVMPDAVQALFAEAARGAAALSWASVAGSSHAIRVCPQASVVEPPEPRAADGAATAPRVRDFAVLEDDSVPRVAASMQADTVEDETARPAPPKTRAQAGPSDGTGSHRLIGLVVHRLLQHEGLAPDAPDERLRPLALDAMHGQSVEEMDLASLVAEAIARFRALSAQPDLRETYLSGQSFHEVPFVLTLDDRIVRGAIDCLVAAPDGVTVLEFKTGRPRTGDRAQAELYRVAAQALFPDAPVETRLVYTSESPTS